MKFARGDTISGLVSQNDFPYDPIRTKGIVINNTVNKERISPRIPMLGIPEKFRYHYLCTVKITDGREFTFNEAEFTLFATRMVLIEKVINNKTQEAEF